MKKNILNITSIFLILAVSFSACRKEEAVLFDFFYSSNGEKECFKIRKDKVIIKCKTEADAKELTKQNVFITAYNVNYDMVIATIDPKKTNLENLMQIASVVSSTYGLEYSDGNLQYPTNKIFVSIKEGQSIESILHHIKISENVEEIELFNENKSTYLVSLNVKLGDILKICRNLFESELCEYAEPSFIREIKPI